MKFFIVTPTYNSLRWLPACIASVRAQVALGGDAVDGCQMVVDQDGKTPQQLSNDHSSTEPALQVHHHIQDGGSTDGTVEFLKEYVSQQPSTDPRAQRPIISGEAGNSARGTVHYQLTFASEADKGMYDAINKGWDRADAAVDWLGHLNSDEQYQPGVLQTVCDFIRKKGDAGAIVGNCIWVDENGIYIASRKPTGCWKWVGRAVIPGFTCAMFFRRDFFSDQGVRFTTSWKSLGDKVFCKDMLEAGCRFYHLDEFISLFAIHGSNLGFQPITDEEKVRYDAEELSSMSRKIRPIAVVVAKMIRCSRVLFGRSCNGYSYIDHGGRRKDVVLEKNRRKKDR